MSFYEDIDRRHRQRQFIVASAIATKFSWYLAALDRKAYRIDYAAWDNTNRSVLICYVEIKCRMNKMNFYPTLAIDKDKIDTGVSLAKLDGVEFKLFICWKDYLAEWTAANPLPKYDTRRMGRVDRRDDHDIDEQYLIPIGEFTKLAHVFYENESKPTFRKLEDHEH